MREWGLLFLLVVVLVMPCLALAESAGKGRVKANNQLNFNSSESRLRVPEVSYKHEHFKLLFESDFFSKYVSKGLPSSEGPVWQPSIAAEYRNVGLSIWANFVLNDEPNQGEFNEVDILPYYNLAIGNFSFVPSVNFMIGVNSDPASLNYMPHNVIRPQFHLSYTIGHFTPYMDMFFYVYPTDRFGMYSDFGVNFNWRFTTWFEINTAAQFAVGGKRWNSPRIADVGTKLNNFEYVLSLSFNVNKHFSLTPVIHVIVTIPESLRRNMNEPDFVWGGLIVRYDL